MPKTATKAAGNVYYIARCEAAKFNDHMASREGAAEELGIDRTRLARIELGTWTRSSQPYSSSATPWPRKRPVSVNSIPVKNFVKVGEYID